MKVSYGTKNKISWVVMLISFVFLFNPNLSLVDPLPDFVGYILISLFLGKLSVLNSTLWEAKKAFEKMIVVDCGRWLAIMWVFGIEAISERSASILVWSFVFAVLEGIFLVPAYIKLFGGISELGDFYPNETIHQKNGKGRLSATERIRNFTVFFVFFKAFMAVLPELSVLSNSSNDDFTYTHSLYRYIGVMRAFCIIPVIIVGIVWLVKIISYFKKLSSDKDLNAALIDRYNTKQIDQKGIFIKKNIKTACWFMTVAAVLSLDFRLEKINILPDILVLVALVPAVIFICKTTYIRSTSIKIYGILYGVFSIISHVLENYYVENYTYNAMQRLPEAFNAYLAWVIVVSVQGVTFVLLFSSVFKKIKTVIKEHTGYVLGKEIYSEGEAAQIEGVHKELCRNFDWALDAAVLYVLSDVLYSLYGAFYAFLNKNMGFLNVINVACGLLFVGMLLRSLSDLKEAVDTKYMLE